MTATPRGGLQASGWFSKASDCAQNQGPWAVPPLHDPQHHPRNQLPQPLIAPTRLVTGLPVTIPPVSLGAGKTTLLIHILSNQEGSNAVLFQ